MKFRGAPTEQLCTTGINKNLRQRGKKKKITRNGKLKNSTIKNSAGLFKQRHSSVQY